MRLLKHARFSPKHDVLWVAGDLVNRGPKNLEVLRYIKALGARTQVVLGNHDLHLLAVHAQIKPLKNKDTLNDVLAAPDCESLIHWLRQLPLVVCQGPWVMSHAGIPHVWTTQQALALSAEVSHALKGANHEHFLATMYGNTPRAWQPYLEGSTRLRVITNYLTRMRFIGPSGELNLEAKEGLGSTPSGTHPWFEYPRPASEPANTQYLFGHWAALEGHTGKDQFHALDTGCVWGGGLTMLRLDDGQRFFVPA